MCCDCYLLSVDFISQKQLQDEIKILKFIFEGNEITVSLAKLLSLGNGLLKYRGAKLTFKVQIRCLREGMPPLNIQFRTQLFQRLSEVTQRGNAIIRQLIQLKSSNLEPGHSTRAWSNPCQALGGKLLLLAGAEAPQNLTFWPQTLSFIGFAMENFSWPLT